MVLASDDFVFAWAIGKALLVVVVSFGFLVYVAWVVTYQKESSAHARIPEESAFKYEVPVKAAGTGSLQSEHLSAGKPESPAAA